MKDTQKNDYVEVKAIVCLQICYYFVDQNKNNCYFVFFFPSKLCK